MQFSEQRSSREISSIVTPADWTVGCVRNDYIDPLSKLIAVHSVEQSPNFSRLIIITYYLHHSMADTDPKSMQDLTNVVSRDHEARISCSSLAVMLTQSSTIRKDTSLKQIVAFL